MSDDLKDRTRVGSRVDVNEKWELGYWSREFGVSPETLKSAVARVGPMAKDVEQHLAQRAAN